MRKSIKFLVICAILTGIGMLLAGIGIAAGGMISGIQVDMQGIRVYAPALKEKENKSNAYVRKEEQVDAFDSIQVDVAYADVHVIRTNSDVYSLSYCLLENREIQKEVKDGKLILKYEASHYSGIHRVNISWFAIGSSESSDQKEFITIYLPKDAKLSNIQLKAETGDIVCENIQADSLAIEADYGDVSLLDVQAQKIETDLESGKLQMEQVQGDNCSIKDAYGNVSIYDLTLAGNMKVELESGKIRFQDTVMQGLDLESNYGDIDAQQSEFGDLQMRIESGNCNLDWILLENGKIDSSYGDVEMKLQKSVTEYGYLLDTEYGDIEIDGTKMGEAYHSLEKDMKHLIEIHCESGNICIK